MHLVFGAVWKPGIGINHLIFAYAATVFYVSFSIFIAGGVIILMI